MFYIFQDLFTAIDGAIATYISDTASNVVGWLTPIFRSALIIFVALWGMAHMRGAVDETLQDGLGRIIKIAIIMELALNLGQYNGLVVDFLYRGPEQLAGVVSGNSPSSAMLDDLMRKGFDLGYGAWEKGGVLSGDLGMYLVAFIVWLGTAAVTAYAGFLLLLSKLALSVLLAVGPLFIVLILFAATQRFFESWLSQVLNYAILLILAVSLLQLLLAIFQKYINALAAKGDISLTDMLGLLIFVIINVLVLRQVPAVASALGGGVALATQGAFSAALGRLGGAAGGLRPTNLQRSYRGVQRDVQLTSRAVAAPIRAAGTAYRRRFGENVISGS